MSDYYQVKRLSNSGMGALARSPAHYQEWINTESKTTPALLFGQRFHQLILEPHLFNCVPFKGDMRTNKDKAAYAEIVESGKTPISPDEFTAMMGMREAVMAAGFERIVGQSVFEFNRMWTDPASGAECKGKADIATLGGIIWDLKTTQDASDFAYSMRKYEYDRQAAFYVDGFGGSGFGWIVVEKEAPYGVRIIRASEVTLASGREKYKPLCELYAQCCFTNEWPGYSTQAEFI
jgi:hypothetical protein